MKAASQELIDLLHGNTQFLMADLFVIRLQSGEVLRYTNADVPVLFEGVRYDAHSLIIKRGATKITRGLESEANELEIAAKTVHKLAGLPWIEAALGGALDGARVEIARIFFRDWQTPVGTITLFSGRVSDISGSRNSVTVAVKSDIELLNVPSPRNIYQAGCMRTLYEGGCGVNRAAFTVNGQVTTSSSNGTELACDLTQPNGWFEQGVIKFISGKNAGLSRTVKHHYNKRLSFALRLPYPPQTGDTFKIYPGCDKRQETCAAKFNNVIHFRGFPYIPAADVIT